MASFLEPGLQSSIFPLQGMYQYIKRCEGKRGREAHSQLEISVYVCVSVTVYVGVCAMVYQTNTVHLYCI